jgi:hypothetical protein
MEGIENTVKLMLSYVLEGLVPHHTLKTADLFLPFSFWSRFPFPLAVFLMDQSKKIENFSQTCNVGGCFPVM